jgi:hAT family C-terminal dimerisation region
LEYFRQHEWEAEWIEAAEDLVWAEFSRTYNNNPTEAAETQGDSNAVGTTFADFGDISVAQAKTRAEKEIDKYLRAPVESVKDPLCWWVQHRLIYPSLSRMALDYLSVPATSTAVERVFSRGRQLLPFTRCALSAASMRMYLCLGSWCRAGLIRAEDLEDAIKGKKRKYQSSEGLVTE